MRPLTDFLKWQIIGLNERDVRHADNDRLALRTGQQASN